MPCGNGVARTSVATSKVDLLSGEVQGWSDGLGGHGRGSRSTQIQLLTELVRRQSRDKSVPERLLMEAEVVLLWKDGGQP